MTSFFTRIGRSPKRGGVYSILDEQKTADGGSFPMIYWCRQSDPYWPLQWRHKVPKSTFQKKKRLFLGVIRPVLHNAGPPITFATTVCRSGGVLLTHKILRQSGLWAGLGWRHKNDKKCKKKKKKKKKKREKKKKKKGTFQGLITFLSFE